MKTHYISLLLLLTFIANAQTDKTKTDKRLYGSFTMSDSISIPDNKLLLPQLSFIEKEELREKIIAFLKKKDIDYVRIHAIGESNNGKHFVIIYQGTQSRLYFISKKFKHATAFQYIMKRTENDSDKKDAFTLIQLNGDNINLQVKYNRTIIN